MSASVSFGGRLGSGLASVGSEGDTDGEAVQGAGSVGDPEEDEEEGIEDPELIALELGTDGATIELVAEGGNRLAGDKREAVAERRSSSVAVRVAVQEVVETVEHGAGRVGEGDEATGLLGEAVVEEARADSSNLTRLRDL